MKVAIVKYNAGNIQSVSYALNRLGIEPVITDDKAELLAADKVIFPGVGEASSAMRYLREKGLDEVLKTIEKPFLGICLGMQLMCSSTEEGSVDCLGFFDTKVRLFPPNEKVPHIGWNTLTNLQGPLFKGVAENSYVYFVHSYYAELCQHTAARCDYQLGYTAALYRDNFYATQFHPEKSGDVGAQILRNFIEL